MCAFFNDGATRHDRDDVSRLDGGQPVSDDDAGPSFSGLIQSRLNRLQGTEETFSMGSVDTAAYIDRCASQAVMRRENLIPFRSLCPGQRWLHPATGFWAS